MTITINLLIFSLACVAAVHGIRRNKKRVDVLVYANDSNNNYQSSKVIQLAAHKYWGDVESKFLEEMRSDKRENVITTKGAFKPEQMIHTLLLDKFAMVDDFTVANVLKDRWKKRCTEITAHGGFEDYFHVCNTIGRASCRKAGNDANVDYVCRIFIYLKNLKGIGAGASHKTVDRIFPGMLKDKNSDTTVAYKVRIQAKADIPKHPFLKKGEAAHEKYNTKEKTVQQRTTRVPKNLTAVPERPGKGQYKGPRQRVPDQSGTEHDVKDNLNWGAPVTKRGAPTRATRVAPTMKGPAEEAAEGSSSDDDSSSSDDDSSSLDDDTLSKRRNSRSLSSRRTPPHPTTKEEAAEGSSSDDDRSPLVPRTVEADGDDRYSPESSDTSQLSPELLQHLTRLHQKGSDIQATDNGSEKETQTDKLNDSDWDNFSEYNDTNESTALGSVEDEAPKTSTHNRRSSASHRHHRSRQHSSSLDDDTLSKRRNSRRLSSRRTSSHPTTKEEYLAAVRKSNWSRSQEKRAQELKIPTSPAFEKWLEKKQRNVSSTSEDYARENYLRLTYGSGRSSTAGLSPENAEFYRKQYRAGSDIQATGAPLDEKPTQTQTDKLIDQQEWEELLSDDNESPSYDEMWEFDDPENSIQGDDISRSRSLANRSSSRQSSRPSSLDLQQNGHSVNSMAEGGRKTDGVRSHSKRSNSSRSIPPGEEQARDMEQIDQDAVALESLPEESTKPGTRRRRRRTVRKDEAPVVAVAEDNGGTTAHVITAESQRADRRNRRAHPKAPEDMAVAAPPSVTPLGSGVRKTSIGAYITWLKMRGDPHRILKEDPTGWANVKNRLLMARINLDDIMAEEQIDNVKKRMLPSVYVDEKLEGLFADFLGKSILSTEEDTATIRGLGDFNALNTSLMSFKEDFLDPMKRKNVCTVRELAYNAVEATFPHDNMSFWTVYGAMCEAIDSSGVNRRASTLSALLTTLTFGNVGTRILNIIPNPKVSGKATLKTFFDIRSGNLKKTLADANLHSINMRVYRQEEGFKAYNAIGMRFGAKASVPTKEYMAAFIIQAALNKQVGKDINPVVTALSAKQVERSAIHNQLQLHHLNQNESYSEEQLTLEIQEGIQETYAKWTSGMGNDAIDLNRVVLRTLPPNANALDALQCGGAQSDKGEYSKYSSFTKISVECGDSTVDMWSDSDLRKSLSLYSQDAQCIIAGYVSEDWPGIAPMHPIVADTLPPEEKHLQNNRMQATRRKNLQRAQNYVCLHFSKF